MKNIYLFSLRGILCLILLTSMQIQSSYAHSWMAPKNEAQRINPIEPTIKSREIGKELYENFCASCHGENAKGLSATDTGLDHDAPNLIDRLQSHSEGELHWKIKSGRNQMPSFRNDLTDEQIWNIINYIKKIN